jgi:hypothetical protein
MGNACSVSGGSKQQEEEQGLSPCRCSKGGNQNIDIVCAEEEKAPFYHDGDLEAPAGASQPSPYSPHHQAKIAKRGACRMRIIQVNDVYLLENFIMLKTLIEVESQGLPRENVVTALPGDFLAPSLLASLDFGKGMIRALNELPIDILCFGNHDGNDIPYQMLCRRLEEFDGVWLNTNMPDFRPVLPSFLEKELVGEKEGETPGEVERIVAFLGVLIGGGKFHNMYREGAFGGATTSMITPFEAVTAWSWHDAQPMRSARSLRVSRWHGS